MKTSKIFQPFCFKVLTVFYGEELSGFELTTFCIKIIVKFHLEIFTYLVFILFIKYFEPILIWSKTKKRLEWIQKYLRKNQKSPLGLNNKICFIFNVLIFSRPDSVPLQVPALKLRARFSISFCHRRKTVSDHRPENQEQFLRVEKPGQCRLIERPEQFHRPGKPEQFRRKDDPTNPIHPTTESLIRNSVRFVKVGIFRNSRIGRTDHPTSSGILLLFLRHPPSVRKRRLEETSWMNLIRWRNLLRKV